MIIERIVKLLSQQNKKQKDLCNYIDVSTSTFSNWVSRNTDPPSKYIIPICEFLNVSCNYLLTGEEVSSAPALTSEQEELLSYYGSLSKTDQRWVMGQMIDIIKKYDTKLDKRYISGK